jgi:hypothetical protein
LMICSKSSNTTDRLIWYFVQRQTVKWCCSIWLWFFFILQMIQCWLVCYRCDKLIAIYIVTCKGPKKDIEWLDIIMFLSKILNQMSRNYPITRKCVFFWMKLQNCKHACSNRTNHNIILICQRV